MKRSCRVLMLALSVVLLVSGGALARDDGAPSPWLGVRLAAAEDGVMISRIFTGSPADRAGLRARDVVVSFDGEPVSSLAGLIGKVRSREPGSWAEMTVKRQGDELTLHARLDTRPDVISKNGMRRGWIGVEAIELPRSLREHFGAPPEAGVMLAEVAPGSPAEAAGFRIGDVVYEVDGTPVVSVGTLREMIAGGGVGNEYEFSVARDGARLVLESAIDVAPPPER